MSSLLLWFFLVRLVPKVFCCDAKHETEQFAESKNMCCKLFSKTDFSPVGISNLISKVNVGGVLLPFLKQTKNAVLSSLYSSPTPTTMLWLSVELGQCYYQPRKKKIKPSKISFNYTAALNSAYRQANSRVYNKGEGNREDRMQDGNFLFLKDALTAYKSLNC